MDIVQVSCSLKRVVAQTDKGLVSLRVITFLHVPTRRFRAEVDADQERYSGDES